MTATARTESPSPALHDLAATALAILARDGTREAGPGGATWRAALVGRGGVPLDVSCAGPDLPDAIAPEIATAERIVKERPWVGTYRLVVRASRLIVFDLAWTPGQPTRVMGFSRGDWERDLLAA